MVKLNKAPYNRSLEVLPGEEHKLKPDILKIKSTASLNEITNRIINQDIFSVIDFLPDSFIDLLFLDPPYNIYKNFNSNLFRITDIRKYEAWMDSWMEKLVRLLKPDASVYICGDWSASAAIYNTGIKYFNLQNRITWEREKGRGAKKNWKNCSEDIWFFSCSKKYTFNLDDVKIKRRVLAPYKVDGKPKDWIEVKNSGYRITHPSNLWNDITVPFWSMPENTIHPTQKPEKLLAKIILASSNEGDLVFDPFLGAGTSAVTAKKLGRNFCGVEIDKHYCMLAQKRINLADSDKSIQGFKDGLFWERNTLSEQRKLMHREKKK
ncbi:MAG TPA: DNA methyltransferase [Ignavibacteriaceae bacterium]|nr:DNA methyltransferase [Ignavibacteriaceae bacterium]